MKIERVSIRRTMRGESAQAWGAALADPAWIAGAAVLKDDPGSSWVRRANLGGRDVVVKCRLLNRWTRRVKSAIGRGHADKHWRGAAMLAAKGIQTARPIFCASAEIDGVPCDLLILEHLNGPTVLELLDAVGRGGGGVMPVRVQHAVAGAVGRTVTRLLKAGLANGDHKPSNLVVTSMDPERPAVAVIDCVAIGRYGWLGLDGAEGEEMAAALLIEPTGCGCPPRSALWMRAFREMLDPAVLNAPRPERHAHIRELLIGVAALIPPPEHSCPRINPLGRAGG